MEFDAISKIVPKKSQTFILGQCCILSSLLATCRFVTIITLFISDEPHAFWKHCKQTTAHIIFLVFSLRLGSNSLIIKKIGDIDIFDDLNKSSPSVFHKNEHCQNLPKIYNFKVLLINQSIINIINIFSRSFVCLNVYCNLS